MRFIQNLLISSSHLLQTDNVLAVLRWTPVPQYRKQMQNCNRQCCRKLLVQHAVRVAMAKRMFNTIRIRIAQKTDLMIIINTANTLLMSPPLKRENCKKKKKGKKTPSK